MTLQKFFEKNGKVAIAFSGGVDSAYLLYAAKKYGAHVKAYYVKSQFQPEFELKDAKLLAKELEVDMKILNLDVLADGKIKANDGMHSYYCKQRIFTEIIRAAKTDAYTVVIDGTNATDEAKDRPGMKALQEMGVQSPLRECGLSKDEIREKSKEAGLFTWDKAAYACLATRIKPNEVITDDALSKIEKAESILFELGFNDFRVRTSQNTATLLLKKDQFDLYRNNEVQIRILLEELFEKVHFDENGR